MMGPSRSPCDYAADFARPLGVLYQPDSSYNIQGVKFFMGDACRFACRFVAAARACARRIFDIQMLRTTSDLRRVKNVTRLVADIRISPKKNRGGPTHRIELFRRRVGKRDWIRRDGKDSAKLPEATATQIAERIRRWLVARR